ncbi:hypothetical protein ACVWWK_007246 [Bradyrhizobium sp. LB9.1b]
MKIALGSIRMTCKFACARFSARAHAAPPKPPPITTTRPADCARRMEGTASDVAATVMPRTAFRRVIGAFMGLIRKMLRRPWWPPQLSSQAKVMFWSRSGTERMRLPVAAKYALSTAGAATPMVGSPTPPQNPPLGTITDSTFGISLMRIEL